MQINEYVLLNAFTGAYARGNQAAVLLLSDLDDDDRLQVLAQDFNLPATTFLQAQDDGYRVRWFAPEGEILLCGHGTVAATWVFTQLEQSCSEVRFHYSGGVLTGRKTGDKVQIEADAILSQEAPIPDHVREGFREKAMAYYPSGNKHIVLMKHEDDVRHMQPDWDVLRQSDTFSYAITAPSDAYDCVSRVILPHISVLEDQATGSAHMVLAPFWTDRLSKTTLNAYQASKRGGFMQCEVVGGRVRLNAACEVFAKGSLA